LWTIISRRLKLKRFRRDRMGISNIIVIALSLVIILAIVSNIVLWNYEMNQVDYEKIKEEVAILGVESVTENSLWIVAQSEYQLSNGSFTGGSYVDGIFESFIESGSGGPRETVFIDGESFEGSWPPSGWTATSRWNKESDEEYDGLYSADFDGGTGWSGVLTTFVMDCSDADSIVVDFWYRDNGAENDEFMLQYYDGNIWNTVFDLAETLYEREWHHYYDEISDTQYFVSDFQVRWVTDTNHNSDDVFVDLVTIEKTAVSSSSILDMNCAFTINLSRYPLDYIQTVELQILYRASDADEPWYLKAYDWAESEYTDSGFNSTAGNLPTTGWDTYAMNLTDAWRNYVHTNGTMKIKFVDYGEDTVQTSVDIDFFGIRVKLGGTKFTFKNGGALTNHLVSLWLTNSTIHQHFNVDIFINSAAKKTYTRNDIVLPTGDYIVKAVTERGNIVVYSGP
jgi:hypothetical protein